MSAYGDATSPRLLLEAMELQAGADKTGALRTWSEVHIKYPPIDFRVGRMTLFLAPDETVEEDMLDVQAGASLLVATHRIFIFIGLYLDLHDENQRVLELMEKTESALQFFHHNSFGLTGLEANVRPTCKPVPGSYNVSVGGANKDKLRMYSQLEYEATTIPFTRGG